MGRINNPIILATIKDTMPMNDMMNISTNVYNVRRMYASILSNFKCSPLALITII